MSRPIAYDPRPGWLGWVSLLSLLAMTFAFVTVNLQIYSARAAFIASHPEYVAKQPPTISRALSDPAIGDGFAFWIGLSALLLFPAVSGVIATFASALPAVRARSPGGARRLVAVSIFLPLLQLGSCIGMVMLSQYTFPDYNDEHMFGSYLFFISQAGMVLAGLLFSIATARDPAMAATMAEAGVYAPGANRARLWVGTTSVLLSLGYLGLFIAKGLDLGAWEPFVYLVYVSTEPVCISSFLLFGLLYNFDLARAAFGRRAAVQGV